MKTTAALGFSVHTGWAVAVAVEGPVSKPKLLHRGRIDLSLTPESNEAFHIAAELPLTDAERHIDRCSKLALDRAKRELEASAASLPMRPRTVGVVVSKGTLPSSLEAILRSHLLIHAGEGALYRTAILDAARALRFKSVSVRSDELINAAAPLLEQTAARLPQWLTDFGRSQGRPWGRDEKDAFLAACIALARP